MPLYDYRCLVCQHLFERIKPIAQRDDVTNCPLCGCSVVRIPYGSFTFKFRPRGWKPYTVEGSEREERVREEICVSS